MCTKNRLTFLFLFVVETFDLVCDWLFYVDVELTKSGLVYGPVESTVVTSLLVFAIIGTVMYLLEMITLGLEKFRDVIFIDSDFLSAVIVWIEDVPQVALSLHIALCREEAISIFQLIKAGAILLEVLIRIILLLVRCCCSDEKSEPMCHQYRRFWRVILTLGVLVETGCAIAIFIVTQTKLTETGGISFRVPQTLVRDEYDEQRYFAGAAVFVHHRVLFDKGSLDDNPRDLTANWVRLASIDNIREKGQVNYRYDFQDDGDQFDLAIWQKEHIQNSAWNISKCYTIKYHNLTKEIVQRKTNECLSGERFDNMTSVFISFEYTSPDTIFKKRVFGHIAFNAKIKDGGGCRSLTNVADAIDDGIRESALLTLHFYLTGSTITFDDAKHLNEKMKDRPAFYRNDGSTLQDVKDEWKTGWSDCDMTGYVGPPLDATIDVPC